MPKVSELSAASGKVDVFYGIQDGVSVKLGANPSVDVRWFGAVGDGTTDDSTAFNAASTAASTAGGELYIPPGTYRLNSQWTVNGSGTSKVVVNGFGAIITTAGAISGLRVTGGSTQGGVVVRGLKIDHGGNATATCGFDIVGAWNATLEDCFVGAHSTQAGYACYRVRNTTGSDIATGSFWTRLERCNARKLSAGTGTSPDYGIEILGASNATNIVNCNISLVGTCIRHTVESGQQYIANAVLVQGSAFEQYTTAYHWTGSSSTVRGPTFVGNRFEAGTTVYKFSGTKTGEVATSPLMTANIYIPGAGTFIDDAVTVYPTFADYSITPQVNPSYAWFGEPVLHRQIGADQHAAKFVTQTVGHGIEVATSNEVTRATLKTKSGGGATLEFSDELGDIRQLRSISGTATGGSNLRGSVTLVAGTASVSFSVAEPDTSYFLALSGSAAESFGWSAKATTGFTVTSSNVASTATVNWLLIR
jgi:hypothetical protein